ncbi:tyrosine-protein phosphatase [Nonomuraea sp. NPDC046802]|uniref:tyrosine-protein phosphatase n=1 Tax=Nonomuraea sp. NPDC046802 TaxID=3154919 RepID=UPI0033F4A663
MPLLNLRDVAAETALRPGVLYRSAQPHALTAGDAELVAGLRLIADLRAEDERTAGDWAAVMGGAERFLLAHGLTPAHADRLRTALLP